MIPGVTKKSVKPVGCRSLTPSGGINYLVLRCSERNEDLCPVAALELF